MLGEKMEKQDAETGRSLLEMIAIFAVMVLLSLASIYIYQTAMIINESDTIHDDLLMRGGLKKEGRPNQRTIFSTDMDKKTRLGRDIEEREEADGYYYSYTVAHIERGICERLLKLSWPNADRIKLNEKTYPLTESYRVKFEGNEKPECRSDDNNAFTVTFKKNTGATGSYIRRACTKTSDCPGTRECKDGVCEDKCNPECDVDEICFQGGCVPKGECEKGNCCPNTCCQCSQDNDVCLACNSGYYLDNTECVVCPAHATCEACSSQRFQCKETFVENDGECVCPEGYIFDSENDICIPCPDGYYCPGPNPEPCPPGTYCPTGSTEPIDCDPGEICPGEGGEPEDCPENAICPDPIGESVDCGAGTPNADRTECNCDSNATKQSDGSCVCNENTCFFENTCIVLSDYDDIEKDAQGNCICQENFTKTYPFVYQAQQNVSPGTTMTTQLQDDVNLWCSRKVYFDISQADDCVEETYLGDNTNKGGNCINECDNVTHPYTSSGYDLQAGKYAKNTILVTVKDLCGGEIVVEGNLVVSSESCPSNLPYMISSGCVQCTNSGHCSARTDGQTACNTSTHMCVCDKGYYWNGVSCTSCGTNKTTSDIGATSSSSCYCTNTCPNNQRRQADCSCSCDGYEHFRSITSSGVCRCSRGSHYGLSYISGKNCDSGTSYTVSKCSEKSSSHTHYKKYCDCE